MYHMNFFDLIYDMANRWGNNRNSDRLFWGAPKSLQMVTAAMKLKLAPWKKTHDQPRQHTKKPEALLCQQRSV